MILFLLRIFSTSSYVDRFESLLSQVYETHALHCNDVLVGFRFEGTRVGASNLRRNGDF